MRSYAHQRRRDAWDALYDQAGTPGERLALVVATCILLLAVVGLVLAAPMRGAGDTDRDDSPGVLVPATAAPPVEFEGTP